MLIRVPDYFMDFNCIADKCKDSCCIGWEIDIDDEAKKKYASLSCELGREITEKTAHGYFPLQENGRCVFLDDFGLCRIISALGDGYLCDICREHPRYYGVGKHGIEGGLGLGCEEAARMILSLKRLPKIIEVERDIPYFDEDEYADLCSYFQDRLTSSVFKFEIPDIAGIFRAYSSLADNAAFEVLSTGKAAKIPKPAIRSLDADQIKEMLSSFFDILNECEALDDGWREALLYARKAPAESIIKSLDGMRGVLYYFTHRYVREGVLDMSIGQRILFALLSSLTVSAISSVTETSNKEVRAAVLYSKNIEYSTDNVDYILDRLSDFL